MNAEAKKKFNHLKLNKNIVSALQSMGYVKPTPIQQHAIPYIISGRDVLGQAQTGTGKTAAFALPLINNMDIKARSRYPQVLVLAPTRELAIQVAEQFKAFSKNIKNLKVVSIYGGQEYRSQIRALKSGVQVVVGTTGRVMDHINKGILNLDNLKTLVLDEADEMLRMGFIDDVKWILSNIPDSCQRLLFSATIQDDIADIIKDYLRDPCKIQVRSKTKTAKTVIQKFIVIKGFRKIYALDRLLEIEQTDGTLIFVNTKSGAIEVADSLRALDYNVSAINGDMQQKQREYIVDKFKNNKTHILVATDVVARGIDLERISHVINYDLPNDRDTYVHRIGRTGRAGREGVAISLVLLKEMRFLRNLERFTNSKLEEIFIPSIKKIVASRVDNFRTKILKVIENNKSIEKYKDIIVSLREELEVDTDSLLAVLALLSQGKKSLFPYEMQYRDEKTFRYKRSHNNRRSNKFESKKSLS